MFTDEQIKNLMVFLNRVEIKGFEEIYAMNEILSILQTSQDEDVVKNKNENKEK